MIAAGSLGHAARRGRTKIAGARMYYSGHAGYTSCRSMHAVRCLGWHPRARRPWRDVRAYAAAASTQQLGICALSCSGWPRMAVASFANEGGTDGSAVSLLNTACTWPNAPCACHAPALPSRLHSST